MATFKEALTTSLTNFAKSIAKTYPKTADIVDNLLSTDSTLPLSAKQGNVLQTQIDTLNSNLPILVKPYYLDNEAYVSSVTDLPGGLPFVTFFKDYEGSHRTFTGITSENGVATIACEEKFSAGNYLLFCFKG